MAQFLSLSTENWNGYIIALALITSYSFTSEPLRRELPFPQDREGGLGRF